MRRNDPIGLITFRVVAAWLTAVRTSFDANQLTFHGTLGPGMVVPGRVGGYRKF